ncbi:inheritance of peroxisomes protein 1-domain-containing protein [Achaetomium macrosporum]|uniref:Inheritance of peroxisomes protein 1 n=1 Tax=Achaetomium macrosporum TaxID=79813 RepID=A0AAN7H926_9PEZI|nr:inheritance of peroxisomes protein 1-domain-containing protein [Achaetomium macrosporum]
MEGARPRSSTFATPRRVFTAPVRPSTPQPAASPQSAGSLVDTLYDHPNVKIVSFTAGSPSLSVGPRAAAQSDIEPGSLPWSTQLERTIAVGPFRIYRAPGSVAFLNCGSALQPILPKSQAWCVDEESSKFVLQIRRPQYWRIEVPVEEQEDVRRAQQLREVFDMILQFEKTECPFKRSFTVEIPKRPETPVKKRPWTPLRRSSTSFPLTPVTPVEIARLHEGTPRGSICAGDLRTAAEARRAVREHSKMLEPPTEEQAVKQSDRSNIGPRDVDAPLQPSTKPLAPPQQVPLIALPLPKARESGRVGVPAEVPKFESPTESRESFHSPESWISTPLPPSPPLSSPGSPRSLTPQLEVQYAQETSAPDHPKPDHTETSEPSQTPNIAGTNFPPTTSPSTSSSTPIRRRPPTRRATTSSSISPSRPAISPFPPAAGLLAPRRASATPSPSTGAGTSTGTGALAAVRRLPITVIHKTCEILMSPPSHLISIMLKVAARITAGEWRGLVFGTGEGGERVSVTWDWSDDEDVNVHSRSRGLGHGSAVQHSGWRKGADDDDWWLKGNSKKMKMVGAFPESSDEEDDEEKEDVGPLDRPKSRETSQSPGRNGEEMGPKSDEKMDGGQSREPRKVPDTEWGVD